MFNLPHAQSAIIYDGDDSNIANKAESHTNSQTLTTNSEILRANIYRADLSMLNAEGFNKKLTMVFFLEIKNMTKDLVFDFTFKYHLIGEKFQFIL